MPSNEQRRAAAKRKLERQLANRAERARRRKQLTIAGSVLGVVVVVAAVTGVYFLTKSDDNSSEAKDATQSSEPAAAAPPAAVAKPALVNCVYKDGQKPADKPATKPAKSEGIPTTGNDAKVSVSMETNQGPIGLTLNNAESPCTVNSFVSLASQNFFDGTNCHRMTTGEGLKVLQCGDPTGSGMGGPGYEFDNEYPTDQLDPNNPMAAQQPVAYKRGTLAMANAGPGTNGSQFFIVYGDSQLPPNYTIFGTVDENTMGTLDKIAKAGQDDSNGPGDGKPTQPVTIQSVRID
ncbi:peptidylprolyl isomerase [Nocardia brasiliensis]|uniref:Peptidyl-prolyl cis-trans isomerase n=1 Tax=Nocardia brasiliensis (strain ATCC 700358 / HUJEG-1) TaxID=1133849 RepID=K0F3F5_NOCB7|nr:peptidylprolyl isomerase [Nocardia brasiliensis]AFU03660.1 putative peptidyl-prolyl cis-trans isomerase [Nocardia brasiliensis ATCC 700358]MBF6131012.1 peptidylprolyl isomerase [Nocardia brasiliensis]OCF89597.1 peptidylprolyl isomerase [Nocardia brasiliensis]